MPTIKPCEIRQRQVRHSHKAVAAYGEGVVRGLGLDVVDIMAA